MKMNVADLILKYLELEGVEYIFGISGAALNPFLAAFNRNPRIKAILTKHEGGAAFMADGYARVKGSLGACFATSGPGATNLVTGVATAYTDNIPIVVLTGQVSTTDYGKGTFQDSTSEGVDSVAIFSGIYNISKEWADSVSQARMKPYNIEKWLPEHDSSFRQSSKNPRTHGYGPKGSN